MAKFSKFIVASIKRTAQNVYPLVRRKTKLLQEIEERQEELENIQLQIDQYQHPIATATGGYTTEDLVERVVITTDKLDKDGKPIKVTQYNLKYPDTVVPPKEEVEEAKEVERKEEAVEEPVENAEPNFISFN